MRNRRRAALNDSLTFVESVSRIRPLHVDAIILPSGGLVLLAGSRLRYVGRVAQQQRRLVCG